MIVQAINEMQTRQQRLLHAHHHPGTRGAGRGWWGASADEIGEVPHVMESWGEKGECERRIDGKDGKGELVCCFGEHCPGSIG